MDSGDRAGPEEPTPRLFAPPLFLSPLKDSSAAAPAPVPLPELARDRGEKMAFHQGRFAGGDEAAALEESSPPPLGEDDDDDEGEAEADGSAKDGEAGVGDAVAADVAVAAAAAVVFAGRGRSIQRLFGELSPSLSLLRARMARDRGDWLATAARGDCADDAEKDEEGDSEALVAVPAAAAAPSPLWDSPNGEEGDTGAERLMPSCDCDGGDSGGRTRWPSDLRRAAPPAPPPPPPNEPPGAELGGCKSAKAAAALLLRAWRPPGESGGAPFAPGDMGGEPGAEPGADAFAWLWPSCA